MRDSYVSDARNIPPYATPIPRPLPHLAAPRDPEKNSPESRKVRRKLKPRNSFMLMDCKDRELPNLAKHSSMYHRGFSKMERDVSATWGSGNCGSRRFGSAPMSTGSTEHMKCFFLIIIIFFFFSLKLYFCLFLRARNAIDHSPVQSMQPVVKAGLPGICQVCLQFRLCLNNLQTLPYIWMKEKKPFEQPYCALSSRPKEAKCSKS